MKKLTLEQIAPYFTDCLYVQVKSVDGIEILPITAIQRKDGCDIIQISNTDYYPNEDDNEFTIAPVLRKCDLTKPIMVNGKEEIPLIELAKMAYPEYEWFINNDECKAVSDGIVCPREHFFIYEDCSFKYCYVETRGHYHTVPNQLSLFKYLYSRMFDLNGLIKKGLAVDADTLEINLYNN